MVVDKAVAQTLPCFQIVIDTKIGEKSRWFIRKQKTNRRMAIGKMQKSLLESRPVILSRMSLQLSTSPIEANSERISSCVIVWGK